MLQAYMFYVKAYFSSNVCSMGLESKQIVLARDITQHETKI